MENSDGSNYLSDVVIIGAGPAGLCLGYHLQRMNINYSILEQGDSSGSSWLKMPDHLHLITLWKSNFLVKEDKNLFHPYKKLSAREFADYLRDFSRRNSLNIRLNCKVEQIEQENGFHLIQTNQGEYVARIVVDCRGYFSFPFVPKYKMSGQSPLMLHFKDYKNREQLNNLKNILIVGKKLSAGQVIKELAAEGSHKLFLSIRGPIRYGASPFFLKHYLRHLDFYEGLVKIFERNLKRELDVPIDQEVKKIIDGQVKIMTDIESIDGKQVVFKDGVQENIDAIIFATGFRPPEVKLHNDFESTEVKNLFYLGRNSQRTFASRFIRGIREDSIILAQLIRGSLESNKRSQ